MTAETASTYADGPRLLADVGASNLRLALEVAPDRYQVNEVLAGASFVSLEAAIRAFLEAHGRPAVRHAALSLPNPILGDQVKLTNHPWEFSVERMRRNLGLQTLLVINDYSALAMGLPRLEASERVKVGGGEAVAGGVLGVIGPGSGLGVSALIPVRDRPVALSSEGGHVSYPPQDADEALVVALAMRRYGHASGERLLSGPGLELIYEALAHAQQHTPALRTAPEVSAAGLAEPCDPVARRALEVFCAMLGTVAGNLALTLGCVGGLYIGGGIVPQMLGFFEQSAFRERFERKGRFRPWLAAIPTWVVHAPRAALRGASAVLEDHLTADHGAEPLLDDIRSALDRLSTSERTVAQDLLSAPRTWMNDPIARIAERCGVSTPTVMRFCRSMGFRGLSDFKLRLGSGLSGTTKVARRELQADDPPAERVATILNNAISALIALRDRLHPVAFERAVQALASARRIEVHGVGASATVALDAQNKFGRLGLPAVARTDESLLGHTAQHLGPGDVLLALSAAGQAGVFNDAAARARRAGAAVIAVCPQRSELARLADIVLPVDPPDASVAPTASGLMQTVIVDVLVGDLTLSARHPGH